MRKIIVMFITYSITIIFNLMTNADILSQHTVESNNSVGVVG